MNPDTIRERIAECEAATDALIRPLSVRSPLQRHNLARFIAHNDPATVKLLWQVVEELERTDICPLCGRDKRMHLHAESCPLAALERHIEGKE